MGEEPPLSGSNGSGTVFFSHCTLGCIYCQNYPWSACGEGELIGTNGLERVFRELAAAGCHNWNLVTPGPWLPLIESAAENLRQEGIRLPFVYNTSGYERVEVAARYRDLMDIVLTDLRYASAEVAREGSGAPDYPEKARAFTKWCCQEVGPLVTDAAGVAVSGTIVRMLVLPGHAKEAVSNLEWLADHVGNDVFLSVMSQYTPVHTALQREGWNRGVTREEYETVTDSVERLGFENGWVQEYGSSTADDDLLGRNMGPGSGMAGRMPVAI